MPRLENGASLIKLAPERPDPLLRRGDVGGDGLIDLSDGVVILSCPFAGGGEPSCLESTDADDDGEISIGDGIEILQFLFLDGHASSSPGAYRCGRDPTPATSPAGRRAPASECESESR